ncbi:MAG: NAD(P)/FAD-dependent oxidoreductase [Hydrogenobacter thermophilus]|uniref:NAD(P)/FAD-dependent oxidoreductase n=1 Tax=Hydrogenobacter thermophilus TaxID=940 RepID=UPI0030FA5ECA|nr:NAD(P)/FAD-dependent oxidoreductase [Hydrogenobacter thermophilus]
MRKYDVLVVGGGPAGSSCAYTLAKSGLKVLVVDFKRKIGTPVQCAEFVPVQLFNSFPEFFTPESISQEVDNMLHFTPWGETVLMNSKGFVLNREVFDYHISQLAREEGAEYLLGTLFVGMEGPKVWLERIHTRERFFVEADVVVGADGPRSRVAKQTGKHTKDFLTTAQVRVPLNIKVKDLLIYFREYIPGGYGWVFPKGESANVGVGIDPAYNMNVMESLKIFLSELLKEGLIREKVLSRTGGWIPAEGLLDVIRNRVLLVGDAGGFCHPITGGGIANAIISGTMAGKAIASGKLSDYEEEAWEVFGTTLERAAKKRKKYMKRWDNLSYIIPRTWIAFEEYWRED